MKETFNLVCESWIPVISLKGKANEISLEEIFVNAHLIKEISDPSPVVEAALHRLMLAILYRVYGEVNKKKWREWWTAQAFDADRINKYLKKWESRFDLFSDESPFYQYRHYSKIGFTERDKQPITKLTFAEAAGNNPTLFDHNNEASPQTHTPAEAARYLIAYQAFTPSAGKSKTIHTKDAPLARGFLVLAKGETLFETLMLNFTPIPQARVPGSRDNAPVWEQDHWKPSHNLRPEGIADYLTWPSRVIKLLADKDVTAVLTTTYCFLAQGKHIKEGAVFEPASGFKKIEEKGVLTIKPWRLGENKAVWRDCDALFASIYDNRTYFPPEVLNWLATQIEDNFISSRTRLQLEIIGLCTESGQPKINFWRRERFPLPLAYLDEEKGPALVAKLRQGLGLAEAVARDLYAATALLARLLLAGDSDDSQKPQPDKNAVASLIRSFGAERAYWAALETPFRRLLVDIPQDKDAAVERWARVLRKEVEGAFERAAAAAGKSGRALKAATKARGVLISRLFNEKDGTLRGYFMKEVLNA